MLKHESRTSRIFMKNLAKLRESHDYTLEQVGESCRINISTLSRYENGIRWPDPDIIDRIADFYCVAVADLFIPDGWAQKAYSIKASEEHLLAQMNSKLAPSGLKLVRRTQ